MAISALPFFADGQKPVAFTTGCLECGPTDADTSLVAVSHVAEKPATGLPGWKDLRWSGHVIATQKTADHQIDLVAVDSHLTQSKIDAAGKPVAPIRSLDLVGVYPTPIKVG